MTKLPFSRSVRILLSTNALVLMATAMLGPIYALFVEGVGGSLMDASIAGGIFAVVAGLTTLMTGKFGDRLREKELIIAWGYVLMGMGFLSYTFIDSVLQLFAVQVLIGLGEAIYAPAFDAVYTKHLDGRRAGTEWGAWEAINYFTTALGTVVGGAVVTFFGFPVLFFCMAGLSLAAALYIFHLKRSVL